MTNNFQNHFHLEDIFIIAVIYYGMIKAITHLANWVFSDAYRNKLLIIRGLPGTGKSHLKLNKLQREGYFILDTDHYIQIDNNSVKEAQMIIANKLLKCFKGNLDKICLTGIFSKKIEYDFYINMARHFGYKSLVWEIRNYSDKPMECFNHSDHKFQEKYNNYLVNSWEKDVDSVVYPSWLEDKEYYNYVKHVVVSDEESESESEIESDNKVEINNESDENSEEKTKGCFNRCDSNNSELNFVIA